MFTDATTEAIDKALQTAWKAFHIYRKYTLEKRANLMRTIARQLDLLGDAVIEAAAQETHLPEARLRSERARTIFQLNTYAAAAERGDWLEATIDTALPDRTPPKADLRKMLIPLGPVVVFGAANFPFAYSTAGGDTASALAAGCPVIVKAHPAHAQTSEMVAHAIDKAAAGCGMPSGVFTHLYGQSFEVGKALVEHPLTKAVGFTGSLQGGKQLFDWANQRKVPIPVFAEMSSTNPVFLMPEKMKTDAVKIAHQYANSITLGVGQFCTNPGLLIGIEGNDLDLFTNTLANAIRTTAPATMLHEGISNNFHSKKTEVLAQKGVSIVAISELAAAAGQAVPTIAMVSGDTFIANPKLHQEVFGPFSLIIKCKDLQQMLNVALHIEGQLTATLFAKDEDLNANKELVDAVQNLCGRFILNGVSTGVEVCLSMHHGGPFPATTDSRFTSVGADAIKRFARPIVFQNWSNHLLPDALKNENPLGIWRTVNDSLTREEIQP